MDPQQNENLNPRQFVSPFDLGIPTKAKTRHCVTIQRSSSEVYAFWRNLENLPLIFKDLFSIKTLSPHESVWTVRLRNGTKVDWKALITEDIQNSLISWRSEEGSKVESSGTVVFQDTLKPNQCTVYLTMDYSLPGGKLTEWATYFYGEDPDSLTITNLKRLKAYLETGEIPTVEGQTSGRKDH